MRRRLIGHMLALLATLHLSQHPAIHIIQQCSTHLLAGRSLHASSCRVGRQWLGNSG